MVLDCMFQFLHLGIAEFTSIQKQFRIVNQFITKATQTLASGMGFQILHLVLVVMYLVSPREYVLTVHCLL